MTAARTAALNGNAHHATAGATQAVREALANRPMTLDELVAVLNPPFRTLSIKSAINHLCNITGGAASDGKRPARYRLMERRGVQPYRPEPRPLERDFLEHRRLCETIRR